MEKRCSIRTSLIRVEEWYKADCDKSSKQTTYLLLPCVHFCSFSAVPNFFFLVISSPYTIFPILLDFLFISRSFRLCSVFSLLFPPLFFSRFFLSRFFHIYIYIFPFFFFEYQVRTSTYEVRKYLVRLFLNLSLLLKSRRTPTKIAPSSS